VGRYRVDRVVGEGTTSRVYHVTHLDSDQPFAMKSVAKSDFPSHPTLDRKLRREIAVLTVCKHPNILRLVEVLESTSHVHVILEFAERGELFDFLISHPSLPEAAAVIIFRDLIYGVDYLHSRGICHRDLKAENILLDASGRAKIADFGFADIARIDDRQCGSPHYMAPEVVCGRQYDPRRADVWSLGVVLFAMVAGRLPFTGTGIKSIVRRIEVCEYVMPNVSTLLSDLIGRMLTREPERRITVTEIKRHEWFRQAVDPAYVWPETVIGRGRVTSVPAAVQKVLGHLGLSGPEMLVGGRVFVLLLTRPLDLAALPWGVECEGEEAVITKFVKKAVVKVPGRSIIEIMATVQHVARQMGVIFLHPDPTSMYCRAPAGQFYCSLFANPAGRRTVVLSAFLHGGSEELFDELTTAIRQKLNVSIVV
jgi:BR serine/threonine kinase